MHTWWPASKRIRHTRGGARVVAEQNTPGLVVTHACASVAEDLTLLCRRLYLASHASPAPRGHCIGGPLSPSLSWSDMLGGPHAAQVASHMPQLLRLENSNAHMETQGAPCA
jgi:hypothetical protein